VIPAAGLPAPTYPVPSDLCWPDKGQPVRGGIKEMHILVRSILDHRGWARTGWCYTISPFDWGISVELVQLDEVERGTTVWDGDSTSWPWPTSLSEPCCDLRCPCVDRVQGTIITDDHPSGENEGGWLP
jgi:hypothetical protein